MTDRTWTIYDIDGTNPRQVTLAQYKAEVAAASARAKKLFAASLIVGPRRRRPVRAKFPTQAGESR